MTRLAQAGLGAVALAALIACGSRVEAPPPSTLAVAELLGPADTAGFERATGGREFHFPADHGPHDGYRTEWWYYTGNLADPTGRRFGYQLTFFRSSLTATPAERSSAWGADQVFMAHFTVTDVDRQRFVSHERFARRALGLAGAQTEPFRIWVEDWSALGEPAGSVRLQAQAGDTEIDLEVGSGKPPVLQGDAGLSQKGAGLGNASYYYSQTRMPTAGRVSISGESFEVSGESWLDREWSTSVLEAGQIGWDWFSLQLDDRHELMVYVIRREDGSADPNSAGTLVEPDGSSRSVEPSRWRLEPTGSWTSPESGARYPSGWTLSVPTAGLELEITPLVVDQELRHTFRYWEGAVAVSGTSGGEPITGRGYVELTGY